MTFIGLFGGLMGKYMKCPRCELNWILETDEYCDVCKAELGMEGFTLLEDEEEDILCPVCGINYIEHNKKMCADCLAKSKDDSAVYANDSETENTLGSQSEENQDDGIEKISFDEIEEEEKFDMYDDAFDDQDDFSSNDFSKEEGFDEEEESDEEEEGNSEDDELEADFNYDIDAVEDIDEDDEEEEDDIDED